MENIEFTDEEVMVKLVGNVKVDGVHEGCREYRSGTVVIYIGVTSVQQGVLLF